MPTATTFDRFSDLPTEIRLSIWRFALFEPRVVKILQRGTQSRYTHHRDDYSLYLCTPPHLAAQACSESHLEASGFLTRSLGFKEPQYTHVNYASDIFVIADHLLGNLSEDQALPIQHLAIITESIPICFEYHFYAGGIDRLLMENLREIAFIQNDSYLEDELSYDENDVRTRLKETHEGEEGWVCPDIRIVYHRRPAGFEMLLFGNPAVDGVDPRGFVFC